jgi:hypothetical protein
VQAREMARGRFLSFVGSVERALDFGFEAEILWLLICVRLGFAPAQPGDSCFGFVVRRGTRMEDAEQKADLVLTVPDADGSGALARIPLQVTTSNWGIRSGSVEKQRVIRSLRVAYISMVSFMPKDEMRRFLRAAAAGEPLELWYAAEILRGALAAYTGRKTVRIPLAPAFRAEFAYAPFFRLYIAKRLLPGASLSDALEVPFGGAPMLRAEYFPGGAWR